MGSPGGSDGKESAGIARDLGSIPGLDLIPGLGRSPGEGNGNSLQYSCLENSIDRGVWWATAYGIAKSQTRLCNFHSQFVDSCLFTVSSHGRRGEVTPWGFFYKVTHPIPWGSTLITKSLCKGVCVCALVAQSCPTLCESMDHSPPASSVHGILQARILEWLAISFPRGSS